MQGLRFLMNPPYGGAVEIFRMYYRAQMRTIGRSRENIISVLQVVECTVAKLFISTANVLLSNLSWICGAGRRTEVTVKPTLGAGAYVDLLLATTEPLGG
jgi:hypothetical protein